MDNNEIVIYQTDRTSRMVVDNTDNYIKTMEKGHVGEDLNITKKRNTQFENNIAHAIC